MSISEERLKSFIGTINKNSKAISKSIENEVKELMKNELNTAEEEAIKEAHSLALKEQSANSVKITKEFAKKEAELKQNIYKKREAILNDIFSRAKEKLINFSETAEYKTSLLNGLTQVKNKFGSSNCTVFVKKQDLCLIDDIKSVFSDNCEVESCNDIEIGGARVFYSELSIIIDKTMDTLLTDEKENFINSKKLVID